MRCLPGLFLVLACSSAPAPASATEWFVAPGGSGPGTRTSPLGRVQDGLSSAQPGDTVTVRGGTYTEALRTVRAGRAGQPIVVRAEAGSGPVVITSPGRVLRVDHANLVFEDLTFDGQYANSIAVGLDDGANFAILRRVEVRRSGRDCVDINGPQGVLIEDSLIHHCLYPADGRSDAHGIVGGTARDLTIRNTEIHTFSGDGIQLDPSRNSFGWTRVLIEHSRIWMAPMPEAENGFAKGVVPGENAIDTKVSNDAPRATLVVRDTDVWGFKGTIGNQAAFNIKEGVDATFDGVSVWDSEIAFRLRGQASFRSAWVTIQNSVIHDVATAIRYEDNIESLKVWNNTFGLKIGRVFEAASSKRDGLDVRNNLLVTGQQLPAEAFDRSNLTVGAAVFVDAVAANYRLAAGSMAVDAGTAIAAVEIDREGVKRPQGAALDVGAYEWRRPDVGERQEGVFGPVMSGPVKLR